MNKEFIDYAILILVTVSVAIILALVSRKLINVSIKKYAQRLKTTPTNFLFLKNSVGFVIYLLALIFIFYKIPYLKSLGSALFAVAGILAVAIGFASQKAFTNIISGIFILIFKPFRINDIVKFQTANKGVVEDITLRHTVIRDFENRRIIIPNSIISEETIINSNIQDEKIKKHILFSISYDSDIDKAMAIIRDEAEKHPLLIDNRTEIEKVNNEPLVLVRVVALNESSVDLKAYVWAENNNDAYALNCNLLKSVKQRFDKEGIEIPYPHRTIVYKKSLDENKANFK